MNVLFAGGGTGGHLYPALAIARAMVDADPRVQPFFIGARRGIEREILPGTEFPHELLDLHPLYRTQPWLNWRTIAGGSTAWRRIAALVESLGSRALVATGGYAAGVALGVAAARGLPIVLQEQNSFPGLTVRWFARRAAQIHLGFPEAASRLRVGPATRVIASGNPIQPPPAQPPSPDVTLQLWGFDGRPSQPIVLIFGGSQGAQAINAAAADWLRSGGAEQAGVRVIWATGPRHHEACSSLESPDVRVLPYIHSMQTAYAVADLAVTRAGAMTTAELAAWGIPAILVPLPTAAADHQTANARAIAAAGAALLLPQPGLNGRVLGSTVQAMLTDPGALQRMAAATSERARPHAAQHIAAHILEMNCFA